MANPSLQIGNSNWAIKESNLLGYSTAGTRFVPQPITMTRASAGTRVNPQGLIETVELLGSELVTNGDFATDTDWTKGTGWTISGGKAIYTGTANASLNQSNALISGKFYKLQYEVISSSLDGNFKISGVTESAQSPLSQSVGTHTVYFTADGSAPTNIALRVVFNTTGTLEIDNVSVKESTKNNLARVDYDGTASSLLVEPQRTNRFLYSEDLTQFDLSSSGTGALNPTVTSNYGVSPDGTQNADRVQFNAGTDSSGNSRITESFTIFATEETISVYLKSNDNQEHTIDIIQSNQAQNSVTVTTEWQRFSFSNVNGSPDKYGIGLTGGNAETADILAWGFQLEQASYPTSYIPTSGSTVTRVQDQYTKTGISNLINSEEGVLFIEMAAFTDDNDGSKSISLSSGGYSDNIIIQYTTNTNQIVFKTSPAHSTPIYQPFTVSDITQDSKMAFNFKNNDCSFWHNGIKLGSVSSFTPFSVGTLNVLNFNRGDGGEDFEGKVKQLQVFKTALTDSELIALTTI